MKRRIVETNIKKKRSNEFRELISWSDTKKRIGKHLQILFSPFISAGVYFQPLKITVSDASWIIEES